MLLTKRSLIFFIAAKILFLTLLNQKNSGRENEISKVFFEYIPVMFPYIQEKILYRRSLYKLEIFYWKTLWKSEIFCWFWLEILIKSIDFLLILTGNPYQKHRFLLILTGNPYQKHRCFADFDWKSLLKS